MMPSRAVEAFIAFPKCLDMVKSQIKGIDGLTSETKE